MKKRLDGTIGSWIYKGWAIGVDSRGYFSAEYPHDDVVDENERWKKGASSSSLEAVQKIIDRRETERIREHAAKIALPIISEAGGEEVIRGVNQQTGHVLGVTDSGYHSLVLPRTEYAIAQVARVHELKQQIEDIRAELKPFTLAVSYSVGMADNWYRGVIERVVEDYKAKLLALEEHAERKQEA